MTPAVRSKELVGLKLTIIMDYTGWGRDALSHMLKNNPYRFDIVCRGVLATIEAERIRAEGILSEPPG